MKFEPMRIKAGTNFVEAGTKPLEVFFLLQGCVESLKNGKFYISGSMFGETDIIFQRDRLDTYQAKMDCHILRLHVTIFNQMLDEFEDIRDDFHMVAEQREQMRLEQEEVASQINQKGEEEIKAEKMEQLKQMEELIENITKQFNEEAARKKKNSDNLVTKAATPNTVNT